MQLVSRAPTAGPGPRYTVLPVPSFPLLDSAAYSRTEIYATGVSYAAEMRIVRVNRHFQA